MNTDYTEFLSYWFDGLAKGLENLDVASRTTLLRACGQACARSYTAQVFRESWERAGEDIVRFLAELAARFPASTYTLLDDGAIEVRYDACGCDLVQCGWVTSPVLCECSAHNLQANFEAALEMPVVVALKASLLRGGEACLFEVRLERACTFVLLAAAQQSHPGDTGATGRRGGGASVDIRMPSIHPLHVSATGDANRQIFDGVHGITRV